MKINYMVKVFIIIILQLIVGKVFGQEAPTQAPLMTIGAYVKIFDQSIGEKDSWYINDHCYIKGPDGKWHMIGITGRNKPHPWDESNFAHAVADSLTGPWEKKPYVLTCRRDLNEEVLWAPHILKVGNEYYMFYCAGHPDHQKYQINLAISKNLYTWQRYKDNPLFMDGYDGRDPFIFRDEPNKRWILYYTATSKPWGGYHIVAAKTSNDLLHWSTDRYVVFRDTAKGTWGGNTESPQVIKRGAWYYLFIGPGANYRTTKVYRSHDLFNWDQEDLVATLESHAAELVVDEQNNWFISSCGLEQGGLYLAPFYWHDEFFEVSK